jgi:hypothetical protein
MALRRWKGSRPWPGADPAPDRRRLTLFHAVTWREPSPLEAAIWYAEQGLPVLPCHWPTSERGGGHWAGLSCSCGHPACSNPARHPLLPGDVARASADPRQVRRWWRRYPQANVGLATGVLLDVLDVDEPQGNELMRSDATLGPVARTGTGRWHLYCAPSRLDDRDLRQAFASLPGSGARVWWRGPGRFVLAPPSRVLTGSFRWVRDLSHPPPDAVTLMGMLMPALRQTGLDG